ncbi:hypothetical protein PIB30_106587 [Stylosanthes scabra]|uniref:Uncharacterized protein n=1 Tax=Stylosanthes scabra TaxID=79078 RepID=A0ABU6XYD0_9FABA|nr:hypothetical protein [Stylosanthes scabra]
MEGTSTSYSNDNNNEGISITRPPIFDGVNFSYWKNRMMIWICSQDSRIWDVIEEGNYVLSFGLLFGTIFCKVTSLATKEAFVGLFAPAGVIEPYFQRFDHRYGCYESLTPKIHSLSTTSLNRGTRTMVTSISMFMALVFQDTKIPRICSVSFLIDRTLNS